MGPALPVQTARETRNCCALWAPDVSSILQEQEAHMCYSASHSKFSFMFSVDLLLTPPLGPGPGAGGTLAY